MGEFNVPAAGWSLLAGAAAAATAAIGVTGTAGTAALMLLFTRIR
jgi:hypothetical protein